MNFERRKHERWECYMIARKMLGSGEEYDFFGIVRNVSAGGAMIETDESPAVGSVLDLAFSQENDHKVWEGQGIVVWARNKEDKVIFGLHFSAPLEEQFQESWVKHPTMI